MLGDFFQTEIYKTITDNETIINKYGGRAPFSYNITKEYLEKYGINSIISGHQDSVSLALLVPTEKIKDGKVTYNDKFNFSLSGEHDLYKPLITNNSFVNKFSNIDILSHPKDDFLDL